MLLSNEATQSEDLISALSLDVRIGLSIYSVRYCGGPPLVRTLRVCGTLIQVVSQSRQN